MGSRPPRPPKVAGVGFGGPQYYLAVDTAAAIGGRTVGIQLPLSGVSFLLTGFGGRRRPDVGAIGAIGAIDAVPALSKPPE